MTEAELVAKAHESRDRFLAKLAKNKEVAADVGLSQCPKVGGKVHYQVGGLDSAGVELPGSAPCLVSACPGCHRVFGISGPGRFNCPHCGQWCEVVKE